MPIPLQKARLLTEMKPRLLTSAVLTMKESDLLQDHSPSQQGCSTFLIWTPWMPRDFSRSSRSALRWKLYLYEWLWYPVGCRWISQLGCCIQVSSQKANLELGGESGCGLWAITALRYVSKYTCPAGRHRSSCWGYDFLFPHPCNWGTIQMESAPEVKIGVCR